MGRCVVCGVAVGNQSVRCVRGHLQPPPARPAYLQAVHGSPSPDRTPVGAATGSPAGDRRRRRGRWMLVGLLAVVLLGGAGREVLVTPPGCDGASCRTGVAQAGSGGTSRTSSAPRRLALADGLPDGGADAVVALRPDLAAAVAAGSTPAALAVAEAWVASTPFPAAVPLAVEDAVCLEVPLADGTWHIPDLLDPDADLLAGPCP